VIAIATLTLLSCIGIAVDRAEAEISDLQRKIDSLFIIASSGEVRYRDQNEPAMDSIAALGRPAVPYLIDKFVTRSARERWTIIWTLTRIGTQAVPDLILALQRPNGLIAERVAYTLGDIKDASAVPPLMEVCSHQRWQVRDEALGALGKIGDRQAAPTIETGLKDRIGQVRKSAAVSCGKLKLSDAGEALVNMFDDPFYGARMSAMEAVVKFDTIRVMDLLDQAMTAHDPEIGNQACRLLGELGTDSALRTLRGQLDSPSPERRLYAALGLVRADPIDNCGFRHLFFNESTDRLARLKIESAIAAYSDEH
jgi:HEAT repeat protein